jgi:iron complex outermembrane recepter protein
MAYQDSPCPGVTRLCRVTLALAVSLGTLCSALAQTAPDSSAPPPVSSSANADARANDLDALLDMAEKDPGKLTEVRVESRDSGSSNVSAPENTLSSTSTDFSGSTSTGDLLKQIPNVSGRRLSGINIDPRVRGYNSSQLNASANGMTQRKSIQDIDSLFSQIDPGVIQELTVIDGPYTSLYGPGFAFITADLNAPKRYDRPEMHSSTFFNYSSNGQILYGRENIMGGGKDWGVYCTYGVRTGNDYRAGGADSDWLVPSSFEKWDTMLSVSYDLNSYSRIEFDMLHTDMNNVQMPGIIYDLDNSANNQYNVRYIIQEDRNGPQQLLLQSWHQETFFHGDASNPAKQRSFYYDFITLPAENTGYPGIVNTLSRGYSISTGVRALRTFGQTDGPLWTAGVDWRRFQQRYLERDVNAQGEDAYAGYYCGIPESGVNDVGALANLQMPVNDRLSFTIGGRADYTKTSLNADDTIVTHRDPGLDIYFPSGFDTPNYTLGMAYGMAKLKLNDHDTLSAGTGFAMRSPDLGETYSNEPFVPVARLGNSYVNGLSNLAPEKDWQFDLGIASKRGPFRYGARGFYATIWDYIMPTPAYISSPADSTHYLGRNFQDFPAYWRGDLGTPALNGDTCQAGYQTLNIDLATMAGGDLFGEVEVRKGVSVFGCMSYVHGQNLRPVQFFDVGYGDSRNGIVTPLGGTEPLPGMYPFNGRLSLRVFDPENDKWGTEVVARFVASQTEVATSLSELASPGFSVFDLRGYYRVRENLRVSLSLENLLNRDYYEPGSLVILNPAGIPTFIREPGMSVVLGVDGRF